MLGIACVLAARTCRDRSEAHEPPHRDPGWHIRHGIADRGRLLDQPGG
jgi:hypothetical protein